MSGAHIIQHLFLRENFKNFQPKLFPTSTNHPIYFYLASHKERLEQEANHFSNHQVFPEGQGGYESNIQRDAQSFRRGLHSFRESKMKLIFLRNVPG